MTAVDKPVCLRFCICESQQKAKITKNMAGPTPCAFGQHKTYILSFPDNYGFFDLFGVLCEKDQYAYKPNSLFMVELWIWLVLDKGCQG